MIDAQFTLSPNLSLLYTELAFADRFAAAADDGFSHVEFWPTDDVELGVTAAESSGLGLGLMNVPTGESGEHGRMAHPQAVEWWRSAFRATLAHALSIDCKNLTLIVGNRLPEVSTEVHASTVLKNLEFALNEVSGNDMKLLLEPLNSVDRPDHLLQNVDEALILFEHFGGPSQLRLLFDAYHLGHKGEDISALLRSTYPSVGYVQVADVPGRHEPGTGTIDYEAFFSQLVRLGYTGLVGLEFAPSGTTTNAISDLKCFINRVHRNTEGENQ